MDFQEHPDALSVGYLLKGQYCIDHVLGAGGFGITYLAHDNLLEMKVAVKEFMHRETAFRVGTTNVVPRTETLRKPFEEGLSRFIREARTLAQFKHPNIIRVLTFFKENGTAYMVMEYEEGVDLSGYIKKNKVINEDWILYILDPLLNGLGLLHSEGIIHRDIKPSNVFIRKSGSPVLLDFGAARSMACTEQLTVMATMGYAPPEQLDPDGNQGAWTDIYAMGGLLYRMISGRQPVQSTLRLQCLMSSKNDPLIPAVQIGKNRYSKALLAGIDHALRLPEAERPQDVAGWTDELMGRKPVESVAHEKCSPNSGSRFGLKRLASSKLFGWLLNQIQGEPRAVQSEPRAEQLSWSEKEETLEKENAPFGESFPGLESHPVFASSRETYSASSASPEDETLIASRQSSDIGSSQTTEAKNVAESQGPSSDTLAETKILKKTESGEAEFQTSTPPQEGTLVTSLGAEIRSSPAPVPSRDPGVLEVTPSDDAPKGEANVPPSPSHAEENPTKENSGSERTTHSILPDTAVPGASGWKTSRLFDHVDGRRQRRMGLATAMDLNMAPESLFKDDGSGGGTLGKAIFGGVPLRRGRVDAGAVSGLSQQPPPTLKETSGTSGSAKTGGTRRYGGSPEGVFMANLISPRKSLPPDNPFQNLAFVSTEEHGRGNKIEKDVAAVGDKEKSQKKKPVVSLPFFKK